MPSIPLPASLPRTADERSALQVARQCVHAAADIAMATFGLPRDDVRWKGTADLVTAADYAVEARVKELLAEAYPSHLLLSEETQASTPTDKGWVWVLDPIDGTKNYAYGIPFFCTNLALCHDGVPQLGLTYDPVRREEFLAIRGGGVRLNGVPAPAMTKKQALREALIVYGIGIDLGRGARSLAMLNDMWPNLLAGRDFGSAALELAYLATGRFDLHVQPDLFPWDIAAGLLLVEEAGGIATDWQGNRATLASSDIVCGSAAIHGAFFDFANGRPWFAPVLST